MKSKSNNVVKVLEYFHRFLKDIIGILLISIALISMLGFFHLSQGKVLNRLVEIIEQGFGWGSIFFLFSLLYI